MRLIFISTLAAMLLPACLSADTVVPTRTIRANAIIGETDVTLSSATLPNGFKRIGDVVGQEARVVLYAGRAVLVDDIGPPAVVTRNQMVTVQFFGSGLSIVTEGRALERGAVGDVIRIMNPSSRATMFGQIHSDGSIQVRK
jgi:flagella basal body P-ring formation protein FlgA